MRRVSSLFVVSLFVIGCSHGSGSIPDAGSPAVVPLEAWVGSIDAPMIRDPAVFSYSDQVTILSGTGPRIVEFDAEAADIVPERGRGYELGFYQDGVPFHPTNVTPWEVGFHRWSSGAAAGTIYMYASLWAPDEPWDFTAERTVENDGRAAFAFLPLASSTRRTAGGLPLDWEIQNDGAPIYEGGTAGVDVVETADAAYVVGELRVAEIDVDGFEATCLVSRVMTSPTRAAGQPALLLCPGPLRGDGQWEVEQPYPSEVISTTPLISLVEGTRVYRAHGKYYVFYSSGSYLSRDNYGGFIAVCDDLVSPCGKILDGDDVRVLVPGLLATHGYYMVGRPVPVVSDGRLSNIVLHARYPVDFGDDILRCKTRRVLGDEFLLAFENGDDACDPEPPSAWCGDGACDAGESCAADCGDCAKLSFAVATSKPIYAVGEELAGTATVQNASGGATSFGVGVTLRVLRDGAQIAELSGGPLYVAADATTWPLPPPGRTVLAPAAGAYRIELVATGGVCTWTAETTFTVE